MFKQSDDDEDTFFAPVSSSKLASLFETTVVIPESQSSNASLIYSPPKQPTTPKLQPSIENKKAGESPKVERNVSLVKIVFAYKLVNNSYESLGKLGLAFVENSDKSYNLILYKTKTNLIFNILINEKLHIIIQEGKYLTFYDEQKQNWSFLFENEQDISDFRKKLELTKAKISVAKQKPSAANKDPPLEVPNPDPDGLSDSPESKIKANILSRMAKMGQPVILPTALKPSVVSDITDSDTEPDRTSVKIKKPTKKIAGSDITSDTKSVLPISSETKKISPYTNRSPISLPTEQIVTYPGMPSSTFYADNLNQLFTENRTQNTEIRLNLMKIDSKIDKIFDRLRSDNEMELSKEIMNLKFQNEQLKLDMQRMQLINMTSNSNLSDTQNKNVHTEFQHVQAENESLKEKLKNAELEISERNKQISDQRLQIEKLSKDVTVLQEKNRITSQNYEALQEEYNNQSLKFKELEKYFYENKPLPEVPPSTETVELNTDESNISPNTMNQSKNEICEENNQISNVPIEVITKIENCATELENHNKKIKELESFLQKIFDENFTQATNKNVADELRLEFKNELKNINEYYNFIGTIKGKLTELTSTLKENRDQLNVIPVEIKDIPCEKCLTSKKILRQLEEKVTNLTGELKRCTDEKLNHEEELEKLNNQIKELETKQADTTINISVVENIKKSIAPVIKQIMNELYTDLQENIKDNCKTVATNIIIQASFKLINSVESSINKCT